MTDEHGFTAPKRPLKDRTPNPIATICGSLTHIKRELLRISAKADDEEDREKLIRAASFVARALMEVEP